jgi:hypothetical protein
MAQQGYLAAGAAASGVANIYSNAYYRPFNSGIPVSSGWGLSFTDSSSTTAQFVPNVFFAAAYGTYRVLNAMLKITAVTGVNSDTMNVWMYPTNSNTTTATTLQEASGSPGYKVMSITNGMRPMSIVSKIHCNDVLGQTGAQYRDSAYTQAALANIPVQLTEWQVFYATMDGNVTVGQVYFTFTVEYDVEFFDPLDPSA